MKRISIIGANFIGLYNAIKYIDTDYIIYIFEKKNQIVLDTIDNYIYNFYNENHKSYINLLKKFNINSIELNNIKFNDKIYNIINLVIDKAKFIPYNIISSYTFLNICKLYLNNFDYDIIINELNTNNILTNINAVDFINIFNEDLSTKVKYYYVTNQDIDLLISRMLDLINNSNNITIKYNYIVKVIFFDNNTNKFILNDIYNYDYIISTLSKFNINKIKLWNNKHSILLNNSLICVNKNNIKNLIDNFININIDLSKIEKKIIIRDRLLNELHIIYPQNKINNHNMFLWNTFNNSIIPDNSNSFFLKKEKIKFIYNNKFFICSLGYCKNNFFINYLIESIDNTNFIKIKKKKII